MKVTDRRMFTDDGELREEYRFLEQRKGADGAAPPSPEADPVRPAGPADGPGEAASAGSPPAAAARGGPADPAGGPGQATAAGAEPAAGAAATDAGAHEMPPGPAGSPGFMDLIAVLAEPIAFLLGDAQLPDGRSAQDLPRARLHIDLLAVLQEKTRGNVSTEETALLDDLLAQLRMRYVEKSRS